MQSLHGSFRRRFHCAVGFGKLFIETRSARIVEQSLCANAEDLSAHELPPPSIDHILGGCISTLTGEEFFASDPTTVQQDGVPTRQSMLRWQRLALGICSNVSASIAVSFVTCDEPHLYDRAYMSKRKSI